MGCICLLNFELLPLKNQDIICAPTPDTRFSISSVLVGGRTQDDVADIVVEDRRVTINHQKKIIRTIDWKVE
jgi:hypothetical protein